MTGSASAITNSSATVSGTVDSGGQATTYWFEYGTRTSYGLRTSSATLDAGSGAVSVRANLTALRGRTTYHYRLVATNPSGTSYGADATLKTGR